MTCGFERQHRRRSLPSRFQNAIIRNLYVDTVSHSRTVKLFNLWGNSISISRNVRGMMARGVSTEIRAVGVSRQLQLDLPKYLKVTQYPLAA